MSLRSSLIGFAAVLAATSLSVSNAGANCEKPVVEVAALPLDLPTYLNKSALSSPLAREAVAGVEQEKVPADSPNLPSPYLTRVLFELEARASDAKTDEAQRDLLLATNDVAHAVMTCLLAHSIPEASGERTFAMFLDLTPQLEELVRTKNTLRGLSGVQHHLTVWSGIGQGVSEETKKDLDARALLKAGAWRYFKMACRVKVAGAVISAGILAYCAWTHYHPATNSDGKNGPLERKHPHQYDDNWYR